MQVVSIRQMMNYRYALIVYSYDHYATRISVNKLCNQIYTAGWVTWVQLKHPRQKLQFLRTRWISYYKILYYYPQELTALMLYIL